MKKLIITFIGLALILSAGLSQDTEKPKSSDEILKAAKEIAVDQDKKIFIMWTASWCGWCKRMDKLMNDESIKEYFDDSFVIDHLIVKERPELKNLENPGAMEWLTKLNADKTGIPFWVILDKNGELLADAYIRPDGVGMDQPGENVGSPANPEEVDHWIAVLDEFTKIPSEGLDKIRKKFTR